MRVLLAVCSAATAAAVAGCGTQSTGGDSSLPPLQLTDAGTSTRALPAVGLAQGGGASGFVLHTTLPAGTPAPAPVWRVPPATARDAARVAGALAVSAAPTAVSGGWVARHGAQLLAVRRGGTWTWGLDCSPQQPLSQENLDVMCASASGGGVAVAPGTTTSPPSPPPTIPPGPSVERARALATPILHALGWDGATLDVAAGSPTTSLTARMNVGGTETADWLTSLTFDTSGVLVNASGWAGTPTRGRSYPLIDAARAYAMLKAEPRAAPEICQVRKDGKPGCEPIPPTVITDVRLGLALRHDLERPLLVPAWLFETQAGGTPMAVVAVDPRWLKPPATTVPLQRSPQTVPVSPAPANPASPNSAGPATKPS